MGAITHNGEVLQGLPADASQINFDKTGTDLNSTQTENAIKEVNTKVNTNANDITQLKSGLTNLVKKQSVVATTDNEGDFIIFSTDHLLIAVIPDRTMSADGCYSGWFSVLVGSRGDKSLYSLKAVDDSNAGLANTKVAVDLYYI